MSEVEVFEVQCGQCNNDFQIDSTDCGTTVNCPHCDSPAEIPTWAEIMGEDIESQAESVVSAPSAAKPPRTPKTEGIKARQTPGTKNKQGGRSQQPTDKPPKPQKRTGNSGGPAKQTGGRSKSKSHAVARRNAQFLLKLSPIFYYLACLVGIAWTIRVVGMLYPIVNSKKGSYWEWFLDAVSMTAWAAALIGLLIAVAELIKVVVHIQEAVISRDSNDADE